MKSCYISSRRLRRLPETKPCQERTYRVGHDKTIYFYHRKNHGNRDRYKEGAESPNTMSVMCYHFLKKILLTGVQPALQRFWNASSQRDKQQLD